MIKILDGKEFAELESTLNKEEREKAVELVACLRIGNDLFIKDKEKYVQEN